MRSDKFIQDIHVSARIMSGKTLSHSSLQRYVKYLNYSTFYVTVVGLMKTDILFKKETVFLSAETPLSLMNLTAVTIVTARPTVEVP